jgi:hypothetical protein
MMLACEDAASAKTGHFFKSIAIARALAAKAASK